MGTDELALWDPGRNPTSLGGVEGLLQENALAIYSISSSFLSLLQQEPELVLCMNMKDAKFEFKNWLLGSL